MKTKLIIISILLAINAYPQIKIQEQSIDNGHSVQKDYQHN